MTILRSGSTKKYSDNWAKAFGGNKKTNSESKKASKKKAKKTASKSKKK